MSMRLILCTLTTLAITLLASSPLYAQGDAHLKQFFEGRTVVVKIDMPGTSRGIDVTPGAIPDVNLGNYSQSLKDNGIAIKAGESVVVTKVKIKGKHIEFQLGGGGHFGYGDYASSYVPYASKTEREKNLERDLKQKTDPQERRHTKEELDALRKQREREDARNQIRAKVAEEIERENIRGDRATGGSRFNIRYEQGTPVESLTPEWVIQALAKYVEFPQTELRR